MKIRMLTSIAGADFTVSRGEETARFSDEEASRMIANGMAEMVDPVIERAIVRPAKEKRG